MSKRLTDEEIRAYFHGRKVDDDILDFARRIEALVTERLRDEATSEYHCPRCYGIDEDCVRSGKSPVSDGNEPTTQYTAQQPENGPVQSVMGGERLTRQETSEGASASQDEAEIERLQTEAHDAACRFHDTPCVKGRRFHEPIDALASLARRLVKERDDAMRLWRNRADEDREHKKRLEKERDEARRLAEQCGAYEAHAHNHQCVICGDPK